jgi:FixJ family two-component response regulator
VRGDDVVVVEDDPQVRRSISRLLSSAGYRVRSYGSAQELIEAGTESAACLVVDLHLGGMSGYDLAFHLEALGSTLPIVFVSAADDAAARRRAAGVRAGAIVCKPFRAAALLSALDRAIGRG